MSRPPACLVRRRRGRLGVPALAASLLTGFALGGCAQARPTATTPTSPTAASTATSVSSSPSPTSETPTACADKVADMSIAEQAGLVVTIGLAKAPDAATTKLIARQHLGGVILTGPFKTGVSGVKGVVDQVNPDGDLLVGTIQEGGPQQPLSGVGFDKVSAPNTQVGTPAITLQTKWTNWGKQLASAGIQVNFAPPGDVLSKKLAANKSDDWDRVYGADPEEAAQAVRSAVIGLEQGGVAATVTHFPGLGALGGAARVGSGPATDTTTKPSQESLAPFRAGVAAGAPGLSVSTVTYKKIDKANPAVYSKTVMDLVRTDVGFTGAIVSDDLAAARLKDVDESQRVLRFIKAGGDLAYVSDPDVADAAVSGLAKAARSDKAVASRLAEAAGNVLGLRTAAGLGSCQVIQG